MGSLERVKGGMGARDCEPPGAIPVTDKARAVGAATKRCRRVPSQAVGPSGGTKCSCGGRCRHDGSDRPLPCDSSAPRRRFARVDRRAGSGFARTLLIACLLLASPLLALEEEEIPAGDWIRQAAIRLNELDPFTIADLWTGPLTRGALAREVLRIRSESVGPGPSDGYLLELEEELAYELDALRSGGSPEREAFLRGEILLDAKDRRNRAIRGITHVDIAVRLHSRFFWHQRIEVDSDGRGDSDFLGQVWQDRWTGQFVLAYGAIRLDHGEILIGRRNPAWGVGREGSLILQAASPSFDQVGGRFRFGALRLEAFVAPLDDLTVEQDGQRVTSRRFLSAHRLAIRFSDRFRLGLTETVLYGGEDRTFDWGYGNPLLLYYAVQWNRKRDDNPFWAIDAYWNMLEELDVWGEFLVDDFQYDLETEPNQIAWLCGGSLKNLSRLPGVFADIEYVRVNNWTYGHRLPWNRYTYGNGMLGHPIGPDADRTTVHIGRRFGRSFDLLLRYRYERQGEGNIDDPRDSAVPFGSTFLTGSVETTRSAGIRLEAHPDSGRRVFADLDLTEGDWTLSSGGLVRFGRTIPLPPGGR